MRELSCGYNEALPPVRGATALFADGGVIGRNPSTVGGTYCYVALDGAENVLDLAGGVITPAEARMPAISNNLTELLALVAGLEAMPEGWHGTVYSDSQVSLGRLFQGWKITNIPGWLVARTTRALRRVDTERIWHVLLDGHPSKAQLAAGVGSRGHSVSVWNCRCDAECRRLAQVYLETL
jgi:ribonuclease HI